HPIEGQHVSLVIDRVEILRLENIRKRPDVSTQARQAEGVIERFTGAGIRGVVDGVVGQRRRNLARVNSAERRGSRQRLKLQYLEQVRRGRAERLNAGIRIAVGQAQTSEGKFAQRVTGKDRCPGGV